MTREDAKRVIRILRANYPSYHKTDQILSDAIDLWATNFAKDPAELVLSAISVYTNQNHEYAPNTGQIRDIMTRMTHPAELSEAEAWVLVQKALSNGLYGAQEEFDKLPEEVQKAVGSPHWIFQVANDHTANMSVESSNFFRRYRQVLEEKYEKENMPPKVRQLVEQLEQRQENKMVMIEDQRAATALDYERRRQEAIDRFMNPSPDEEIPDMQPKTFTKLQELKERLLNGRLNDTDTEHEIQPTT